MPAQSEGLHMISCTRCGGAIQETDVSCPHCGAALAQQVKGVAEASSTAKAGGAIGAAGSIAMFVQNLMIVIGLLLLVVSIGVVFSDPSGAFDQAFVGVILIMYSFYVDYLGLAIIGVGLVVISVGLRKVVSGKTMALGLTAGIMCILWVVLTYLWRVYYPEAMAESLSVLLEDIMGLSGTTAGTFDTIIDQVQGMMYTWIGASVLLIIASFVFAFFISGVGKDTNYPGKLRSYSWPIFTIVNGVGTLLVATFVLGALNLNFNPTGLLAGLFIKGLVVPIIALYVYISLLRKFLKLGKVTEHPAPVAYPAAPPAPAYYPPPPVAPAPPAAPEEAPPVEEPPAEEPAPPEEPGPPMEEAPPEEPGPQPAPGLCASCGQPLVAGDKFCMHCGAGAK